jgi:hypothetical protein
MTIKIKSLKRYILGVSADDDGVVDPVLGGKLYVNYI